MKMIELSESLAVNPNDILSVKKVATTTRVYENKVFFHGYLLVKIHGELEPVQVVIVKDEIPVDSIGRNFAYVDERYKGFLANIEESSGGNVKC